MELMNLLSDVGIAIQGPTYDIALNWIGKLIRLLIGAVGSVGIGIILFSVILKVIVLPFDIYQRVAMRKQNLKMKENQAKMEKLQKQYANDKDMYNQKVMEMYKESGFSKTFPKRQTRVLAFFDDDLPSVGQDHDGDLHRQKTRQKRAKKPYQTALAGGVQTDGGSNERK